MNPSPHFHSHFHPYFTLIGILIFTLVFTLVFALIFAPIFTPFFLQERTLLERYGARVAVLGDLSLLPAKVQKAAAEVMTATESNTGCTLNICFSYT